MSTSPGPAPPAAARKRWKLGVVAALAVALATYLTWFLIVDTRAEHDAARRSAAANLHCPIGDVEIGDSHQVNDGPSQYEVHGCGRTGHVECFDVVAGFPAEYLQVDYRCTFAAVP